MEKDRDSMLTLTRQMVALSAFAAQGGSVPQDEKQIIVAVLESVRATYLALSAGVEPWPDAGPQFLLSVTETGKLLLTQGTRTVPVDDDFLEHLLFTSGLSLEPGQVIFLQPSLAKRAIEESLWNLSLAKALTRETGLSVPARLLPSDALESGPSAQELDLITANFIAEELVERWSIAGRRSTEA
jgi:hypothetical protein